MRPQLCEQLVLQRQGVDVAPAVLEPDAGADVDQGQVVVEEVRAQGHADDEPAGERDDDDEEPGESGGAEVAPGRPVKTKRVYPLSASGTGFRGSGPMYSDCGRIMRLWAACSSTCALQPATRETANVGVKNSFGRPMACSTPAE